MALRWGIVGASKISHDFCTALRSQQTTHSHQILAIASRTKSSAEAFALQHDILHAYGTYSELAQQCANIEIVYVGVLNNLHYEVVKMLLQAGKNVLCEKPFAMNHAQAKELLELAEKQHLLLVEGLWSRFFPVYRHLTEALSLHSFGEVKELYVKHGFCGQENARITQKELGGGIVLDIGCYAIQLVLLVFQQEPKSIKAQGKVNAQGVDLSFTAELQFSHDRCAYITCSGLQVLENQATLITTKGAVCIPTYWCPTQYIALSRLHEWPLPSTTDKWNYTNSIGLTYEADYLYSCIRAGQTVCDIVPPKDTLLIAKIQDEIRKQLGVKYDCDKA